ncbi:MAG TPA: hypothetical protein VEX68_25350 [Bryobacteraceae bacterium]|nr:hypothetical protein [Bryobacteraceae bacterium]
MAKKNEKNKPTPQPSHPAVARRIYTNAFVCQYAIREQSTNSTNVLTAFRIVDLHTIEIPPVPANTIIVLPTLAVDLVVQFRSETAQTFDVVVTTIRPDDQEVAPASFPAQSTQGGVFGAILSVRVTLDFKVEGLYWFDVFVDDELATRVPLLIKHIRTDHS